MNRTGQTGEKARYTVILLLVVGLTAFSSAMKDLNQLRYYLVDGSELIAQLSDNFAPAPMPLVAQATEIPHTDIKVEICDLKQSVPAVDLPWMSNVAPAKEKKPRAIVPRPSQVIDLKNHVPQPGEIQLATLKQLPQIDFDPAQFEFRIATDAETHAFVLSRGQRTQVKSKECKSRDTRINPRDREVRLKTLNRSINLRIAS